MQITIKPFDELTIYELYDLLQLREEVFIIEQNCIYRDIDNYDSKAFHLLGYKGNELVGYARLFSPGIKYSDCSIGRVVVKKQERLNSYGKQVMSASINFLDEKFKGCPITISAQLYLKKFYQNFGFVETGDIYHEDGIPHIKMIRNV